MATMDHLGASASHIDLEETQRESISIDDLRVAGPDNSLSLSEARVEFKPDERTLIVSERGASGPLLLRAIIGIWPWGGGQITRPPRESMIFLPKSAYVPPGELRSALFYPNSAEDYDDAAVASALTAVGLEYLLPSLDTIDRWDRRLTEQEKQCLAFARVLLQRPQWLVANGVFDEIDAALRPQILALFQGPLAQVGLINIGQAGSDERFFTRKLRLVVDVAGPTFKPSDHCVISAV
jgi:putative ATP-binding cassette transporter